MKDDEQAIQIAISTDVRGHRFYATLLASILRRTNHPVHVRCWCRGFAPPSFETRQLKVEFRSATEPVAGRYPAHVGAAVFDRLRVIADSEDWDRCLVMDYDQLALTDLWPLYTMKLGDSLLAARMHGPGLDIDYAMTVWRRETLPAGWEHVAKYPYFTMGPLLNLAAMREASTWEKLQSAHMAFDADEQLALTAATDGRTEAFDKRWNLFPIEDGLGGELPDGVIHWTGWPKPWHPDCGVWRADLWESERVTWEHLRMGLWNKPLAIEFGGRDGSTSRSLAERGWRVIRVTERSSILSPPPVELLDSDRELNFPDMASFEEDDETVVGARCDAEFVRFGTAAIASEDLAEWEQLPHRIVLDGPQTAKEITALKQLGYGLECRLTAADWPAGGPHPKVLDYHASTIVKELIAGEWLYLELVREKSEARLTHVR